MRHYILALLLLFTPSLSFGETIAFDDPRWTITGPNTTIVHYKGQQALYAPQGGAYLPDANFIDGIIEFDMLFPDDTRGFSGVNWRRQKDGSYENFYIRPHLSGKEDGTQYTPSIKGDTGWQLYFGPGYTVTLDHTYDKWVHIKVISSGDQAEIYVDSEDPVLFIKDLKADLGAGTIGVSTNLAPTFYANFSYQKIDNPPLKGTALPEKKQVDGLIQKFSISELLADDNTNPNDYTGSWITQEIETMGALNLSRHRDRTEGHNSVLVRMTVNSDRDQLKKFSFGYSDDAIVYMNGNPISGGTHLYQSRDYRHLGSIGLFDDVYLPLKSGNNDIYFAVKENFGGWGFMGKFEDMNGIIIN
ncbi:MAG: hypothetical protein HOH19_15020 [Kordiimonadaceae bacterium]|jgi:hypothetical protein|nr:hypothetical protein [Kordiimonadaceae bacterium]MBT6033883.1 hypothetical protein [Kordiimonadaceae bacterium]